MDTIISTREKQKAGKGERLLVDGRRLKIEIKRSMKYFRGEMKFKKEHKVGMGDSNVHTWGVNVTSRGNSQTKRQ